jgi:hypothetical protein
MDQKGHCFGGLQFIEFIYLEEIEQWNLLQLIHLGELRVKGDRWWGDPIDVQYKPTQSYKNKYPLYNK